MQKTLLIMRNEIWKMLHSPGYVLFAFIVPSAAVLVMGVINILQGQPEAGAGEAADSQPVQSEIEVEGFVDRSGLIRRIPAGIHTDHLLSFESESLALQALQAGKITAYYIIPPDIIESGEVDYVYPDTRSYLDDGQSWVMEWTLLYNLLGGDADLTDRIFNPARNVTTTSIAPQADAEANNDCSRPNAGCKSNDLIRYMPSIMAALFYATFMASSSMLFNSISTEKENRTVEVLILSVSSRQLLAGKTLGLGSTGLLQAAIWLGAIYACCSLGGYVLRLPEDFVFPVEIIIWSLIFYLGGYAIYASLMAGAGALVPKMKEAGAANFIVMLPLFIGYGFGLMAPLTGTTNSGWILFLSLFPLTSPIVMVMRLTAGSVPFWQLGLTALLLFVSAIYMLRTVANMFQAQNLLSGQPFTVSRYLHTMFTGG